MIYIPGYFYTPFLSEAICCGLILWSAHQISTADGEHVDNSRACFLIFTTLLSQFIPYDVLPSLLSKSSPDQCFGESNESGKVRWLWFSVVVKTICIELRQVLPVELKF
ncbi:hypothetical protein RHMOL_Rhmol03G0161500 [Rhododendron molle]|uniref:Uncharacterized protein n=1 Tax=Rhododendron molle TaxID=49168 RepID=A0ACC0PGH8_RHOML|nr:hypothetical protein RHMOL_Rhmol03G0161500 [Rhododendron molle]